MRHAFLITLLLAAQAISWNASPLFLCMGGDGSLCIDLGPGSCACCQHGHDWAEDLSHNPSANGNRHSRSHDACNRHQAPATIEATPCDCTHLQITVSWTAVTVSPETIRPIVLPSLAALVGDRDWGSDLSPLRASASLSYLSNDISAATALRSDILRC
jgi:hypothetical protein